MVAACKRTDYEIGKTSVILPFSQVNTSECRVMNMDSLFNANVTDIFRNEYLTPRSPYTTLQLPVQGIGEWCHPKLTADIDDAGLRALVRDEMLTTKLGAVPNIGSRKQYCFYFVVG